MFSQMNNKSTLTPEELVRFFMSKEKRADLNKTDSADETPNGLMQEDITVEPLEEEGNEDTFDFLKRMLVRSSEKVTESKEELGEQLAAIKEKALANIDTIKNTQLKSQPNPFIGGSLSPMLTEAGVEQEVEKFVDPMLRDPDLLEIPTETFDETDKQTEEALTDAEIADIASSAIDDVGEAQDNQPNLDDVPTGGKDSGEGLGSFETIKTGMEEADPSLVEGMTFSKLKKDFVVGYLAGHEGIDPHKSIEGGKDTAAYGIKNSLGIERVNYKSGSEGDKEFAAAVALKHYEKTERKFKTPKVDELGRSRDNSYVWDDLGEAGRYALTDLHFNAGTIGSSSKDGNAKDAITNTLNYIGMTTKDKKTKGSLFSLAKRRALNWNKAADELGLTKIDKIQQMPRSGGGTIMNYLDVEGNVVHKVSSGRKPIKVINDDGDYKILTTTREEEI